MFYAPLELLLLLPTFASIGINVEYRTIPDVLPWLCSYYAAKIDQNCFFDRMQLLYSIKFIPHYFRNPSYPLLCYVRFYQILMHKVTLFKTFLM